MTRDELRSVFRDEAALLQKAGLGKPVGDGTTQDQNGSKVSGEDFDTFLASIDLERDGIVATRDSIVAFLQLEIDQDDPVFGLPAKMTINPQGETVDINERLIVSVQPRVQVIETSHWVAPTKYTAGHTETSRRTDYWDDIWFRHLFWRDSAEHSFRWDCSRARPGHRLIALFRNEKRAAIVNFDTRTYWVEKLPTGCLAVFAILAGALIATIVFMAPFAQSLERGGASPLGIGTTFATALLFGISILVGHTLADEHEIGKACSRLLGGQAPPRETAWKWRAASVLFAIWTVFLIIPTAPEKAPAPQRASLSPTKKVPQINAPKAKMPNETIKKAPAVTKSAAPAQGSTPMQRGYQNIKARCERYAVKNLVVNCTNSTLALLLDPSRNQEWAQRYTESEREDMIAGVRKFLAEAQARNE